MIRPPLFLLLASVVPAFSGTEIHLADKSVPQIIEEARTAEKPVTIHIGEGLHFITDPIILGAQDSGLTFVGDGANAVISGGKKITGWKVLPDGLWKAEIPEVKDGKWYFQQLWINGRRATRARTPNKGFLHMEDRATSAVFPFEPNRPASDVEKWEALLKYQAFITSRETIALFEKITPAELRDVEITIPHTWDVHHYHVSEINPAANAVLMRGPAMRELLTHEPDGRFHVENFRAALDAPGEWFLSRTGEILYSPLPGEKPETSEIIAPIAEKILVIDGAKDLTFRNVSFRHQQWTLPEKGYGDSQAASQMGAAIEVDRSENITFDQCEIAHTGGYALWFRHDVSRSSAVNNHIHDLGAGGIRIGPTSQPGSTKTTSFITVDNNIIQHAGRIFPDAIGVFLGHASDCSVTHNDIGDLYYTGISAGWHWGYGETVSHRNRYENNHIHHIGWGYTSDMGGFYNLGTSLGSVVRGNHVHDISSYRYGGWGLYTDEGSTGILFENNLVHDTRESGFHQHYGYYNTIRNNIFAFGKNAQIQRSRPEKRLSFIYENNIIVWNPDTAKLLHGTKYNWDLNEKPSPGEPKLPFIMRKNLYWPVTGKMPELIAEAWTWKQWQEQGRDKGSIVADPQFEDLAKRDFRLKPGSPAFGLGFKPWDLNVAGVRNDSPRGAGWRELAAKAKFENWETDSVPAESPPYHLPLQNFEFTAPGTLPILNASADLGKKDDSIGVTEEVSSPIPVDGRNGDPSKRSLKIQDAPDLPKSYLPVLNLNPKWPAGPIEVTFDIMAQPGADWFFEIRTGGGGEFAAGPYFSWKNGKLTATANQGIPLVDLPAGEWVRARITATPGTGKWTLELLRQDGTKKEFKDLPCKASWDKANYILWSALANRKTAFFIDNLALEPGR